MSIKDLKYLFPFIVLVSPSAEAGEDLKARAEAN